MLRVIRDLSRKEALSALTAASEVLSRGATGRNVGEEPSNAYAEGVIREVFERNNIERGTLLTEVSPDSLDKARGYLQDQIVASSRKGRRQTVKERLGDKGLLGIIDYNITFDDGAFKRFSVRRGITQSEAAKSLNRTLDVVHFPANPGGDGFIFVLSSSPVHDFQLLVLMVSNRASAMIVAAYPILGDWTPTESGDVVSALNSLTERHGRNVGFETGKGTVYGHLILDVQTLAIPSMSPGSPEINRVFRLYNEGGRDVGPMMARGHHEPFLNWDDPRPSIPARVRYAFAIDTQSLDEDLKGFGLPVQPITMPSGNRWIATPKEMGPELPPSH